jgi:hypothetical protein
MRCLELYLIVTEVETEPSSGSSHTYNFCHRVFQNIPNFAPPSPDGMGGILDELSNYVTVMTMSFDREGRSLRPGCEHANRLAEGSKGRRHLYCPWRSFEQINSGTHSSSQKISTDQCRSRSIMEMLGTVFHFATTELTLLVLLIFSMNRVLSKTIGIVYLNDVMGSPIGLHTHTYIYIQGVLSRSLSTRQKFRTKRNMKRNHKRYKPSRQTN